MKDVKVLIVDDNALILDLLMRGLMPHCDARAAADGADALLVVWTILPTWWFAIIECPASMGASSTKRFAAGSKPNRYHLFFLASRSGIEEKLRRRSWKAWKIYSQAVFLKDLVRSAKSSRPPTTGETAKAAGASPA